MSKKNDNLKIQENISVSYFFQYIFFFFLVYIRFKDIKDEETVPHKSPMEHLLPCLSRYRTRFSIAALRLVSS